MEVLQLYLLAGPFRIPEQQQVYKTFNYPQSVSIYQILGGWSFETYLGDLAKS